MRVLIVDDEPAARRRLRALLDGMDVDVVGEAADGVTALARIQALRPDVVLLDIAMPEADGFEVARHLPSPPPLVIFQTAYNEYALKAFDHDAIDYVVKPVTRERLLQAIARVRRRLPGTHGPVPPDLLARIDDALAHDRPVRRTRVLVRHGTGHRSQPLRDVTRFSAEDGLVYAVTPAGRHLTDYTLNELEARLAGLFARASRSDLVNLDRVDRIASNRDGSATLTMHDRTTVRVSRRRAGGLREALG